MADNKIISYNVLKYYDSKIKTWVNNKLSTLDINGITEDQVQSMVDSIIDKMIANGSIASQATVEQMIDDAINESGIGVTEAKVQEMIDKSLSDYTPETSAIWDAI